MFPSQNIQLQMFPSQNIQLQMFPSQNIIAVMQASPDDPVSYYYECTSFLAEQ